MAMSYSNTLVPIPSHPFKITRKPLASGSYVYVEIGRSYNSQQKHTVPIRKTIGKLEERYKGKTAAELQEATHMYPNSNYVTYILDKEILTEKRKEPSHEDSTRSSCLSIGTYIVIRRLFVETGIRRILESVLGRDAPLFMDLVAYLIICQSNEALQYSSYCYKHPLFTEEMIVYSDSILYSFLKSVTIRHSIDFQDEWNKSRDKSVEILLSTSEASKNAEAEQIEKVEYRKALADLEEFPSVNYAIAYDATNYDPLFYELYPGYSLDAGQLSYTIDRLEKYKYKKMTVVLNRGYFSEANIHGIESAGLGFILMAGGKSKVLQEIVSPKKGTFETDITCYLARFHVYGTAYEGKLYESDIHNRHFHVYCDDIGGIIERETLYTNIGRYREALDKLIGKPVASIASFKDLERYFDFTFEEIPDPESMRMHLIHPDGTSENDKHPQKGFLLKAYREKSDVITRDGKSCGYFAIVTNRLMSSEEAIPLYMERKCFEKLSLNVKFLMEDVENHAYPFEIEEAKTFIEFVASIIRNRMFYMLNTASQKSESRPSKMSVLAAIAELEKIEIIHTKNQSYALDHTITALQKNILSAFGLTEEDVEKEIANINTVLSSN